MIPKQHKVNNLHMKGKLHMDFKLQTVVARGLQSSSEPNLSGYYSVGRFPYRMSSASSGFGSTSMKRGTSSSEASGGTACRVSNCPRARTFC